MGSTGGVQASKAGTGGGALAISTYTPNSASRMASSGSGAPSSSSTCGALLAGGQATAGTGTSALVCPAGGSASAEPMSSARSADEASSLADTGPCTVSGSRVAAVPTSSLTAVGTGATIGGAGAMAGSATSGAGAATSCGSLSSPFVRRWAPAMGSRASSVLSIFSNTSPTGFFRWAPRVPARSRYCDSTGSSDGPSPGLIVSLPLSVLGTGRALRGTVCAGSARSRVGDRAVKRACQAAAMPMFLFKVFGPVSAFGPPTLSPEAC